MTRAILGRDEKYRKTEMEELSLFAQFVDTVPQRHSITFKLQLQTHLH